MRRILLLVLVAAATLAATSCHKGKGTIVFKNYEYEDNPFANNEDTLGVQFSIKIQLPTDEKLSANESAVMKIIRDTLLSRMLEPYYNFQEPEQAIQDYCDSIRREFDDWGDVEVPGAQDVEPSFQWVQELSLSLDLVSDDILVFTGSIYADLGGEHPSRTTLYFLFDRGSGALLKEETLLTGNEAHATLGDMLKEQLKKNIASHEELQGDAIDWESVVPNGNFHITQDSIIYHYDTYELGDYDMGDIEIALPCFKVKELLNPQSALYKFWFQ